MSNIQINDGSNDAYPRSTELVTPFPIASSFATATSGFSPKGNVPSSVFYQVLYNGSDSNAPVTTSDAWQWNVWDFGTSTRRTQIAVCPFRYRGEIFMRQKHDSNWHGWYKIHNDLDYIVEDVTSSSYTLNRLQAKTYNFSVSKNYYTPIGMVGWAINGTNSHILFASRCRIEGSDAVFTLNNTHSGVDVTFTITASILYKHTGASYP